jgi:hypothetical protein
MHRDRKHHGVVGGCRLTMPAAFDLSCLAGEDFRGMVAKFHNPPSLYSSYPLEFAFTGVFAVTYKNGGFWDPLGCRLLPTIDCLSAGQPTAAILAKQILTVRRSLLPTVWGVSAATPNEKL